MFRIIPHRLFVEPRAVIVRAEQEAAAWVATLRVDGMVCSACAGNVQRRLQAVDGVLEAYVSLEGGCARVAYQPGRTDVPTLTEVVERAALLRPARRLLASVGRRVVESRRRAAERTP